MGEGGGHWTGWGPRSDEGVEGVDLWWDFEGAWSLVGGGKAWNRDSGKVGRRRSGKVGKTSDGGREMGVWLRNGFGEGIVRGGIGIPGDRVPWDGEREVGNQGIRWTVGMASAGIFGIDNEILHTRHSEDDRHRVRNLARHTGNFAWISR